jgi:Flp pilus assembly pilin Flp
MKRWVRRISRVGLGEDSVKSLWQAGKRALSPRIGGDPWREPGQGLMEYGLILALVSIFAILALFVVGASLATVLSDVHHTMQQCVSGGSCTPPS